MQETDPPLQRLNKKRELALIKTRLWCQWGVNTASKNGYNGIVILLWRIALFAKPSDQVPHIHLEIWLYFKDPKNYETKITGSLPSADVT